MKRACAKCEWFSGHTKRPRKGFKIIYGACKRYPPMVANIWHRGNLRNEYVPAGYLYPEVHSDKWCGEFKPKKNKETQDGKDK